MLQIHNISLKNYRMSLELEFKRIKFEMKVRVFCWKHRLFVKSIEL